MVSCRRRGIDPSEYVREMLIRLPGMKPSELPTLLARYWETERQASKLNRLWHPLRHSAHSPHGTVTSPRSLRADVEVEIPNGYRGQGASGGLWWLWHGRSLRCCRRSAF